MANITIIDKNNNRIIAEGLTFFERLSSHDKYLFYTLNEQVDPDLVKMYVANVVDKIDAYNVIEQNEWKDLVATMMKITHHEDTSDEITYLRMDQNEYMIGSAQPKKIAIKYDKKQAFIDDYAIKMQQMLDQSKTPVTVGSTEFFNQSIVNEGVKVDKVENAPIGQNIFDNPLKPIETNQVTLDENQVQEVIEQKIEETQQTINIGSDSMITISQADFDSLQMEIAKIDENIKNIKEIMGRAQITEKTVEATNEVISTQAVPSETATTSQEVIDQGEEPAITTPDIQVGDGNVLGEESVLYTPSAQEETSFQAPETISTGTQTINTGAQTNTVVVQTIGTPATTGNEMISTMPSVENNMIDMSVTNMGTNAILTDEPYLTPVPGSTPEPTPVPELVPEPALDAPMPESPVPTMPSAPELSNGMIEQTNSLSTMTDAATPVGMMPEGIPTVPVNNTAPETSFINTTGAPVNDSVVSTPEPTPYDSNNVGLTTVADISAIDIAGTISTPDPQPISNVPANEQGILGPEVVMQNDTSKAAPLQDGAVFGPATLVANQTLSM